MNTHRASAPYLGFSKDHPQDDARKRFKERFGADPEEVFIDGTTLLVGPIPEAVKTNTTTRRADTRHNV